MRPDELFQLALTKTDNENGLRLLYSAAVDAFRKTSYRSIALEFGTRNGGSALALLAAILATDCRRVLVTVDPYGSLPYRNDHGLLPWRYTSKEYRNAMAEIAGVARAEKLNWVHYLARDDEYMDLIWPNLPLYLLNPAEKSPMLAFAYLDAEHTNDAIRRQLVWAQGRLERGGAIIVDDVDWLSDQGDWVLSVFPKAVRKDRKIFISTEVDAPCRSAESELSDRDS